MKFLSFDNRYNERNNCATTWLARVLTGPPACQGPTPLFIALIPNQSVAKGGPSCRVGQICSDLSTGRCDQVTGIGELDCESAICRRELPSLIEYTCKPNEEAARVGHSWEERSGKEKERKEEMSQVKKKKKIKAKEDKPAEPNELPVEEKQIEENLVRRCVFVREDEGRDGGTQEEDVDGLDQCTSFFIPVVRR